MIRAIAFAHVELANGCMAMVHDELIAEVPGGDAEAGLAERLRECFRQAFVEAFQVARGEGLVDARLGGRLSRAQ